ncbi:MAG: hypothetical protein ACK5Q5_08850 [Planctomycetaceae bacterium]
MSFPKSTAVLGMFVVVALLWTVAQAQVQPAPIAPVFWQYKVMTFAKSTKGSQNQDDLIAAVETEINNLGTAGWELSQKSKVA